MELLRDSLVEEALARESTARALFARHDKSGVGKINAHELQDLLIETVANADIVDLKTFVEKTLAARGLNAEDPERKIGFEEYVKHHNLLIDWLARHAGTVAPPAVERRNSLQVPPLPPELVASMANWDFDVHAVAEKDYPMMIFTIILQHGVVEELGIRKHILWNFVNETCKRYHPCPFHSFRHATDVTLTVNFYLHKLEESGITFLSDPLDKLSTLIAALVHDVDHPGVSNLFLVATKAPLALQYDNKAPLEHHHLATARSLLKEELFDFLSTLSEEQQKRFDRNLELMIMGTDVATHIPFMKTFAQKVEAGTVAQDDVMQLVLKAADISNPAKPMHVYRVWMDGVMTEFFSQGDMERRLGLPISMNCDRSTVDITKCQLGFVNFIVAPIINGFAAYLPALQDSAVQTLNDNVTLLNNGVLETEQN